MTQQMFNLQDCMSSTDRPYFSRWKDESQVSASQLIVQNIIPTQRLKINSRADNTVFKTGVSYFRKCMQDAVQDRILIEQFRELTRVKKSKINMSTFPKLLWLCKKHGIQQKVSKLWQQKIQKIVNERKQEFNRKRLQTLKDYLNRQKQALKQAQIFEAHKIYWGNNFRQKSKFNQSEDQLRKFTEAHE